MPVEREDTMINRSKTLAASLLGATFLLGVAAGGFGFAALANDDAERPVRRDRPSYSEILTRELALTPAQQESVRVILDRREEAMHRLWKDISPRFDTLRAQIRNEIRAQLDSSQTGTYEEMIRRSEERRREDGERGSHGR
jgi:hypothetical protein